MTRAAKPVTRARYTRARKPASAAPLADYSMSVLGYIVLANVLSTVLSISLAAWSPMHSISRARRA